MRTFWNVLRDSLWAFVFQFAPRLASALLFIWIGHSVGLTQAGNFSLAATYLVIVSTLMRGLDELVVRQTAREPTHSHKTLTTFLIMRLGLALLLYGGVLILVWVSLDYSFTTAQTITVLTLSVIPDSLAYVAQAVLLGHRQFQTPALVMLGTSIIRLLGGIWLLGFTSSILWVAWLWVGCSSLGTVLMIALAVTQTRKGRVGPRWDWLFLSENIRTAVPFVGIAVLLTVDTQVDNIILSIYRPEADVAWYFAATTLLSGFLMLSQAYRFSIYPLMTQYAVSSPKKMISLYTYSIRYIGIIIVPIVVGLMWTAPKVVGWIYGDDFKPVIHIWRILCMAIVFIFMNEPNSRIMLVNNRQRHILIFLAGSAIINIFLNLLLVPQWGALGTAYARFGSSLTLFIGCVFYVTKVFVIRDTLIVSAKFLLVIATSLLVTYSLIEMSVLFYVSLLFGILIYVTGIVLFGIVSKHDIMIFLRLVGF